MNALADKEMKGGGGGVDRKNVVKQGKGGGGSQNKVIHIVHRL